MRKINPAAVRAGFRNETNDLIEYMTRARSALRGEPNEKADVSRLASMVFLDMYVGFERFLSDLFLAYLNRDFSHYQSDLEGRVLQSVEQRFGNWPRTRTQFGAIAHVRVDDLEQIIDPDGWSLTFKNTEAIREKADAWLAPAQRSRVHSIGAHDRRLIDTAHAIRDFIAHQSRGSKSRMNEKLATISLGGGNAHLGRGAHEVQKVGSYLKSVFNGRSRVEIYADRLIQIALSM